MKYPESLILELIETNGVPFLMSENMFKELEELQNFILKFYQSLR